MTQSDNLRGAMLMNVAMLAFTLGDTAMKVITQTVPLSQAMFLRGVLTSAGLLGVAWATGALRVQLQPGDGARLGWRTLGEVASTVTFFLALMHMELANLSAIMQTLPLAVTLAAAVFLAEPVGWRRMTAIGIGFGGMLLIIQPGGDSFTLWSLMGVVSMLFVVLRDLSTRRMSRGLPSALVAVAASVAVTLTGLGGLVIEDWQPVTGVAVWLIPIAATTLLVGYLSVVAAMRVGELAFVAPFRYTALFWALILGWLVFGTLPNGLALVGAMVVAVTGIYTFWRERQSRR